MTELEEGAAFKPPTEHPMRVVEIDGEGAYSRYRLEWDSDPRFPGKTFSIWVTQAQMDEWFGKPN